MFYLSTDFVFNRESRDCPTRISSWDGLGLRPKAGRKEEYKIAKAGRE